MSGYASPRTPPRRPRYSALSPPCPEAAAALADGLTLAGSPLEPPAFHPVDWTDEQLFYSHHDPDRCNEYWEGPSFLSNKSPMEQRAKAYAEGLNLPKSASGSFAKVVHGVLDEEDCRELISRVNRKGYTPALLNIGGGKQRLAPDVRDGFRAIVDSPKLAAWLFEVLQPFLPQVWDGQPLADLNERCRFLCYTPGQQFDRHFDGSYERPSGELSRVTVQLYLHDVPVENGGATAFLFDRGSLKIPCQPRAGSVLLFSQEDLEHEGSRLLRGLKYTMRSEIMYGQKRKTF